MLGVPLEQEEQVPIAQSEILPSQSQQRGISGITSSYRAEFRLTQIPKKGKGVFLCELRLLP